MCADPIEACRGADILLVATEWPEFAAVDLIEVRRALAGDVVVDRRNMMDPVRVRTLGLRYSGMGVPDEDFSSTAAALPAESVPVGHS